MVTWLGLEPIKWIHFFIKNSLNWRRISWNLLVQEEAKCFRRSTAGYRAADFRWIPRRTAVRRCTIRTGVTAGCRRPAELLLRRCWPIRVSTTSVCPCPVRPRRWWPTANWWAARRSSSVRQRRRWRHPPAEVYPVHRWRTWRSWRLWRPSVPHRPSRRRRRPKRRREIEDFISRCSDKNRPKVASFCDFYQCVGYR